MRKDKKNKIVKQKTKIGAKDKLAGLLFEQIIKALFDKYEPFRDKYTFEEYCRELVNLSNDKRNNENYIEKNDIDIVSIVDNSDIGNDDNIEKNALDIETIGDNSDIVIDEEYEK